MSVSVLAALAILSAPQSRPLTVFETTRPPPRLSVPEAPRADGTRVDGPAEVQQICRDQAVTGSRFPVRVCRSVRQTGADRDESRDWLREIQRQRKQEVPE